MNQRTTPRVATAAVGAVALVLGVGLVSPGAAEPATGTGSAVVRWIDRTARPLDTIDPDAPLDDLTPLRRSVGDASIVGLGEPAHEVAEVTALKHRTLRFLVERMGFRSIAFEDDWSLGLSINSYLRTGAGDLDALLRQTGGGWATREVADMLTWLRSYNAGRAEHDQVQFVGVEYYTTFRPAYEIVDDYVAETAPDQVAELNAHLEPLRPRKDTAFAHAQWYMNDVEDKQPYVEDARAVYDLVARIAPGDSVALHAARQIRLFYEHYTLPFADALVSRDANAAANLRWWRETGHDRIVYWAASAHSGVIPELRITAPPGPDMVFPSVGSYLHRWYGRDYRSIGFTFDHGTLAGRQVPPPAPDWFERPFGATRHDQLLLDLREPAPAPVRHWLHGPVTTRGFVDHDPPYESYASGGTLAQWFDVIVHRQVVTAATPL
jgi:erythromycin esterase-like protein